MALIPGTLPSDTCYGTPQDLLELFAQYLDVPAFALNSKVVFSTSQPSVSDAIWIDITTPTNPILKISNGSFVDYLKNYITNAPVVTIVGADSVLILDASDSGNTKRGLVSDISVPAAGSVTFPMLSTSATEANNVASRVAKAWVNFNGTGTVSITASFNVSSITDNSTGNFTANFTAAMADAKYATVITTEDAILGGYVGTASYLAGSVRFRTIQANTSTPVDLQINSVVVFR
jgi:hypothetical protein